MGEVPYSRSLSARTEVAVRTFGLVGNWPDVAHNDDGLFGPDSMTWRIVSDPAYAVGGIRALVLQALHPLAMGAVAHAGGFAADPWGRLSRTGEFVATLTFGTTADATRAAARVRGIHRRIKTVDPVTGRTYRADEPDLLLWVHCCEVDSLLSTVRRAGAEIDDDDADRYVREQVLAATIIGIPEEIVPASTAALADYFERIRPQLAVTEPAAAGLRAIARPPMPIWVRLLTPARPAWATLAGLGVAALPPWARKMYGLPGVRTTDAATTAALKALRVGLKNVPEEWRQGPAVRAAKSRVA